MKNKFKWSSIGIVVALLVSYTHCDLLVAPTNKKSTLKTNDASSIDNSSTIGNPSVPSSVVDFANSYSFFEEIIRPEIESKGCLSCHSSNGGAPLSIENYDEMKDLLMNMGSFEGSTLLRKMTGSISHGGGVKCGSSSSDLCSSFSQWYALEFSQDNSPIPTTPTTPVVTPTNPNGSSAVSGSLEVVSALGKLNGWAEDGSNPGASLIVEFYLDGPKGSGEFIGRTTANLPGGSVSGNHGFIYYIPVQYRDGKNHQLYAYAIDLDENEVILSGSPKNVTTYSPSLNGYNYYQVSVKPILDNRCASCHAVNYDQHFNSLISPTPSGGGSATNNEMINMPSGVHNGIGHPGGNICGSKNGSPCLEIQRWWQEEFN